MAVLFGRMRSISRGHGSSAMTAAAYRSCSKLTRTFIDEETGIESDLTYDYTDKKGLVFSQIFAPNIAGIDDSEISPPEWIFDRQSLWQRIEDIETRVNSELAKEYVIALPKEFTVEQNIELLKEFVETSFLSRGMVVDVNYHADNPENPHAHIMFPMRSLEMNEQGEIDFGGKQRIWKSYAVLNEIKQEQRLIINEHYAKYGFEYRLEWGAVDGLESTFHHGGIKNLWKRNQEIIQRNSSRIIADPYLVIDKLNHNKVVFTKEDIERELEKALQNNIHHLADSDASNDIDDKDLFSNEKQEDHSDSEYHEHNKISKKNEEYKASLDIYVKTEVTRMLGVVLSSPELTIVNNCDLNERMLFAKTKQVEIEQRFIGHITELQERHNHQIIIEDKDIAKLGINKEFTAQQKDVIRKILAGRDISIIEGWPGAGKSTVTKEIVRHYIDNGYKVIAAAPTNKAAQELSDKLGIRAYTTTALRMKWQLERGYKADIGLKADYYKEEQYQFKNNDDSTDIDNNNDITGNSSNSKSSITDKTILIMDEISMIDLPNFDYFAAEVAHYGAKLIGLGDNNQNQAIGMRGGAGIAIEIAGSNLLTEVNRHKNPDQRIRDLHKEATAALSRYQIPKAISIYDQLGKINILEDENAKEQKIAERYITKLFEIADEDNIKVVDAFSKIAISAYTNAELNRLNSLVRSSLKRSGILANEGVKFLSGGVHGKSDLIELCIGDQIIFKTNQREEEGYGGVMNNEIATISKIIKSSEDGIGEFVAEVRRNDVTETVIIKTGEEKRPISFNHAYAITNYAIQGASIKYKLFSVDKHSGYEVTLVGLTRHIDDCEIFAARTTLENEVYQTQDLNVEKVRNEYKAISYKYVEVENGKMERKNVPLWKIGLNLLASKRSNLNFATDYSYGYRNNNDNNVDNDLHKNINTFQGKQLNIRNPKNKLLYEDINAISVNMNSLRPKLEEHIEAISKYEYEANGPIELSTKELSKYGIDKKNQQQISRFSLFVAQHFNIKSDEVYFDVRDVIAAPDKYNSQNIDNIDEKGSKNNIKDHSDRISLEDHINILKTGVIKNGTLEKLKWQDLGKLDQNIILYSYLDEEDKELLTNHVSVIAQLEEEIKQYSVEIGDILKQIETDGKDAHEELTGNFAIMRDYLAARASARQAYKDFNRKKITEKKLDEIVEKRTKCATRVIAKCHNHNNPQDGHQNNKNNNESNNDSQDKTIEVNQISMFKILSQVSCNYQTIAKHAREADERHYFEKIFSMSIAGNRHYRTLMELINKAANNDLSSDDIHQLQEAYIELIREQKSILTVFKEKKLELKQIYLVNNEDIKKKQAHTLYKHIEFNRYIGDIYETNRLEVIQNLDGMLSKTTDKEQLILAISKSPEMLGKLQNRGIVAKMFKAEESRRVNQSLSSFKEKLELYVKGDQEVQDAEDRAKNDDYTKKIQDIESEISTLKAQLVNEDEKELLVGIRDIEKQATKKGGLNEQSMAINISKLFREDKVVDLFFNWQAYIEKAKEISKNYQGSKYDKAQKFKQPQEVKQEIGVKQTDVGIEQKVQNEEQQNKHSNYNNNKLKIHNQYEQKPRFEFSKVAQSLSNSDYESLFRMYAQIINPDGKMERRGNNISCGSLHMNLTNGVWNRFSDKSSGNIFGFVSIAKSCSKVEALEIIATHAGVNATISDNYDPARKYTAIDLKNNKEVPTIIPESKNEWKAVNKVPKDAKRFIPELYLKHMSEKNNFTAIYNYRNSNNELIGYGVRFEDKETSKKQVLPVAYCYRESTGKYSWKLKGFSDGGYKPIYGLEKLRAYEESKENNKNSIKELEQSDKVNQLQLQTKVKPILIVEGEKTADHAQKILPEYIVISWMGGAGAVDRVNWQELQGREVIIWPDNDEPGRSCANGIKEHIDIANGHIGLVNIVGTEKLNLPTKWDLADELPETLSITDVRNIITRTNESAKEQRLHEKIVTNSEEIRLSGWKEVVDGLEILEAKGKISTNIDRVHSNEIFKQTLSTIALKQNREVIPNMSLVNIFRELQEKYDDLNREYELDHYKNSNNINNNEVKDKKQQLAYDLTKEAVILQQLQLGVKKLPQVHVQYISETANNIATHLKQYKSYELKGAGDQLCKAISSDKWWEQLEQTNNQLILHSKEKLNAKTTEEYTKLLTDERKIHININISNKLSSEQEHTQLMNEIQKATKFLTEKEAKTESQLLHIYKVNVTPQKIHQSLVKECHEYNADIINRNLKVLSTNKPIHIDKIEFTCPQKYLEHLHDNHKHDYVPYQRINKVLESLKNQQQQLQKQREISGPSL